MSILPYLSLYAEPESACTPPRKQYDAVTVVPLFDEVPSFLDRICASPPKSPLLWILVVNASIDRAPDEIERTQYLLDRLTIDSQSLGPGISLSSSRIGDLVIVDRVSEGRQLPKKQGVGLARKIGCDLALAWQSQGIISSPWIHCTDADATLPGDYFARSQQSECQQASALVYPFWHEQEAASREGRSLELYEISLRYYVLGLAWAGSPYAFHCIGSTMAVRGKAYAMVRGMPKRRAGEDFYLLNKVAKESYVHSLDGSPIQIHQRKSQRTPFGTGPAVEKISANLASGTTFTLYHPQCFSLLREWIAALNEFAKTCDISILDELEGTRIGRCLPLDTRDHLTRCARDLKTESQRQRRLQGWFDSFRTLKFIHALRDMQYPKQAWREALDSAPFVPSVGEFESLRQTLVLAEEKMQLIRHTILLPQARRWGP